MGRTLSTNRRGEEVRDRIEIIDPPCSEFNPSIDINDTSAQGVGVLSPMAENFDGRVDMTPPYDCPNPDPLVLGMTEAFRIRPVRTDDAEDYRLAPRRR